MIGIAPAKGRSYAVMGLARSGLIAARALLESGASVVAWDDNQQRRVEADLFKVPLADLSQGLPENLSALILSPGIPHTHPAPHPAAALAKAAGVPIIGDVELLFQACPTAHFVGITGTNGKSTTTALIGHILSSAELPAAIGGNIGVPALALPRFGPEGWYVLEMSSYQLELTPSLRFDVAALLNISPDHLARHGGMTGYVASKRQIFSAGAGSQHAVIGIDDPESRRIHDALVAGGHWSVVPVSVAGPVEGGVSVSGEGQLIDASEDSLLEVLDLTTVASLPGVHNWQNAAIAYAACVQIGLHPNVIASAIASFPGLAHRQQPVAEISGVRFVNDSKATNADAAARALACYEHIYWIAGGQAKEGGLDGIEPYLPNIRRAFLIGAAAEAFGAWLEARGVSVSRCGVIGTAVARAYAQALVDGLPGACVLLSPACASFDQFRDFEHRGDVFVGVVRQFQGGGHA